jgi:hypothetical protein
MLVLLWTLRTCFGTEEQQLLQQLLHQQHPDVRPSTQEQKSVSAYKMKTKNDAALRKEAYHTIPLPSHDLQQQDKLRKLKIQFT